MKIVHFDRSGFLEEGKGGMPPPKATFEKFLYILLQYENNFDYNFAYQRVKSMKGHGFFYCYLLNKSNL